MDCCSCRGIRRRILMTTLCIYCPEIEGQRDEAEKHFNARGIGVDFVRGIHAMSAGLLCHKPHGLNGTTDLINSYKHVGLCLSHYMCWSILEAGKGSEGLILEADAKLPIDWHDRTEKVLADAPDDWDIILLGSSHTQDKERTHIKGDLWEVKYPFCCHAYLVRQKALPILLDVGRHVNMNVDIMLMKHVYPHLRVYTVLPRIVEQRFTELPV